MGKSPFFKRSPRLKLALPTGKIIVHRPKAEPMEPKFSFETMIIPIFLTLATVGVMFYLSKTMNNNSTYAIFILAMSIPMLGSYIATILMFFRKKRLYREEVAQLHEDYLLQMEKHREEIIEIRERQAKFLREKDPNPEECKRRIEDRKSMLWERTPSSDDFLSLRIGLGTRPFVIDIQVPAQDGYDVNPLIAEAQKLRNENGDLVQVPVTIPLREKRVVGLAGDRKELLELARILALQLVTHHSPEEVKIAAAFPETESDEWTWMKWLPHVWDDNREMRYLAEGQPEAQRLSEKLYSILNIRKLEKSGTDDDASPIPEFVFFLPSIKLLEDDALLPLVLKEAESVGASTILMAQKKESLPMECELIIEVQDGIAKLYETFAADEKVTYFTGAEKIALDQLKLAEAKALSRDIAPLRVKQSSAGVIPRTLTFLEMYGANKVEDLNVSAKWAQNRYPLSLPVPIGVREGRKPVMLNIHDKIERQGHGPHGLMAGTTGSGKSEVIQSLILSLAVNYHPHEMAFMLIDYKGGGMSNTFQGLPHVTATITNLEDPNLISRAKVSLRAELERRQKLFNKAGNIQHIDEYFKSDWRFKEPLPHLFIVIDEFAQLKKDQPEFMDELISIAAIGRTLGVHLLLATQKPAGVVDDKIWSNSRFRICLRVQDDNDSREMIKIPNASHINVPGRGYFQVGNNEVLEFFQSAWSGADYIPDEGDEEELISIAEVALDGSSVFQKQVKTAEKTNTKQIQALIDYIRAEADKQGIQPLPGPWLEPLPTHLPITKLMEVDNWSRDAWEANTDWLQATAGLVDDVSHQSQYPLTLDLREGHLIAYGMPGAGKTSFLQSLLLSLFFRHSPRDVNAYLVDFSRQMREYSKFPHVGGIVHEEDTEKLQRLFKFLLKELSVRKELFSNDGLSSLQSYRTIHGGTLPAIFLVIDGYQRFKSSFEKENEQLEILLREGATYGIHVIATANQTNDMYDRFRNNFSLAVSFELADHTDYYFAVGRPNTVTSNLPEGRGFVKGNNPPRVFQAALAYEGENELEKVEFFRKWVHRMEEASCGMEAPEIAMLPKEISLAELENKFPARETKELPFGIDVDDLDVQSLTLSDADHIFVTGRVESGKTSLLQTFLLSMGYQYSPDEIDIYLIEMEPKLKGMMSLASLPHVKGYATNLAEAKEILERVSAAASARSSSLSFGWDEDDADNHSYPPIVIMIDDAENFMQQISMDFDAKGILEKITKEARQKDLHLILSGSLASMNSFSHEAWFSNFKKKYVGFLLGSTLSNDLYFFNIRLPHMETDKELPAGDGFMVKGKHTKVKIAKPFNASTGKSEWAAKIKNKYPLFVK